MSVVRRQIYTCLSIGEASAISLGEFQIKFIRQETRQEMYVYSNFCSIRLFKFAVLMSTNLVILSSPIFSKLNLSCLAAAGVVTGCDCSIGQLVILFVSYHSYLSLSFFNEIISHFLLLSYFLVLNC